MTLTRIEDVTVGSELILPDRDVFITAAVPATREETLAYGARELRSGTWWRTFEVGEWVDVVPRDIVRMRNAS